MNIKSLLIGSAAALVAVSGARAADAIVAAEPEPVEYVRVCDAFGTGFFYIPGTETCLNINGYVRFRVTATKGTAGYTQNTRARINFDARSETELGTLQSYIRLQSNSGNTTNSVDAPFLTDQAVIRLGGLFMGYTESAFAALYGGGVGNWGFIQTDTGGVYGYQQRQQLGYRYDAGAWYAAVVLEHDANPSLNWTPDVVGVLGVTQGWGGAFVHVGYDETLRSTGVKAGVQFDVAATGGQVRIGGFYSSKIVGAYGMPMPGAVGILTNEVAQWSGAIGYTQPLTDTIGATLGYQYFDGFSAAKGGTVKNAHLVEGALTWDPVQNLNVRLEGNWGTSRTYTGVKTNTASGFMWVRRSF